ncbi:hypothetical protein ABEH28_13330 [Pseudomonas sp. Ps21-P2]
MEEEVRKYLLEMPTYPNETKDAEIQATAKRKSFERFTGYNQKRTKNRKI